MFNPIKGWLPAYKKQKESLICVVTISCLAIHLSRILNIQAVVPLPCWKPNYSAPVIRSLVMRAPFAPDSPLIIPAIYSGLNVLSWGVCGGVLFSTPSPVQLQTFRKIPVFRIFCNISVIGCKCSGSSAFPRVGDWGLYFSIFLHFNILIKKSYFLANYSWYAY